MRKIKYWRQDEIMDIKSVHEWLILSSSFSCVLLLLRIIVTMRLEYIFLPWNLFLAFIPYAITEWVMGNNAILASRVKLLLTLGVWLLFIPNAFYILTDMFHFTNVRSAPKWFDLLLIFSFAWNGILCGIISLRKVEAIMFMKRGRNFSVLVVFAVMWLNAFGIYIGRFLRYNSWDVITDPFSLAGEIIDMAVHPFQNGYAWGMTLCYAVFMSFLYLTLKRLGEVFTTTD